MIWSGLVSTGLVSTEHVPTGLVSTRHEFFELDFITVLK